MRRISTNMANDNMQYHLQRQNQQINKKQYQLSTQSAIRNLRDDPMAVSHATRFLSNIDHLNRYQKNINKVQSDHATTEAHVNHVINIMQRVNELAIQGAQDTFSNSDRKIMANEINQLLEELVMTGNTKDAENNSVFAGQDLKNDAFRVLRGNISGVEGRLVTNVSYIGSHDASSIEIRDGDYVENRIPGNDFFWADIQGIYAVQDTSEYIVPDNTSIFINRHEIRLTTGDTVEDIIGKINASPAGVTASLDDVRNSLIIRGNFAHEINLEDRQDSSVLADLGVLSSARRGANSFQNDVTINGGSLFDAVIEIRDQLYAGNSVEIGGRALKGVQSALTHIVDQRSKLGSVAERVNMVSDSLAQRKLNSTETANNFIGLDVVEAITRLKMLEYAQAVTMQTTANIIKPTLMDFLR